MIPLRRFSAALLVTVLALGAGTAHGDTRPADKLNSAKPVKPPKPIVIVVIGDSLADGLWASLYRAYIKDRHVKVIRETLNSSGFTAYNWLAKLEVVLRKYPKINLVVAQMGTNDRQRLIIHRQRWPGFRTEGWIKGYRDRVEKFMARLRDAKISTVWVGLLIVRRKRHDADYQFMNAIYKSAAEANSRVAYLSSRALTKGDKGEYVAFKRDQRNRRRRFRHDDGIHFSDFGYDLIAQHVIKVTGEKWPGLVPLPSMQK